MKDPSLVMGLFIHTPPITHTPSLAPRKQAEDGIRPGYTQKVKLAPPLHKDRKHLSGRLTNGRLRIWRFTITAPYIKQ